MEVVESAESVNARCCVPQVGPVDGLHLRPGLIINDDRGLCGCTHDKKEILQMAAPNPSEFERFGGINVFDCLPQKRAVVARQLDQFHCGAGL